MGACFNTLTIFRCTVQWHKIPSYYCATITIIRLQKFSSSPQPLAITILLSVSMNLTTLGNSHEWNHTYLSFCDRHILLSIMVLRFIRVVVCVRISLLFKTENYSIVCTTFCLFIHLLMNTWVTSTLWLLWIILL